MNNSAADSTKREESYYEAKLISPSAMAFSKKMASSKKNAMKFLKEAGILDKNGELAKEYR